MSNRSIADWRPDGVGERKLVFFGGGDGICYAFEALSTVPEKPVKLKTA